MKQFILWLCFISGLCFWTGQAMNEEDMKNACLKYGGNRMGNLTTTTMVGACKLQCEFMAATDPPEKTDRSSENMIITAYKLRKPIINMTSLESCDDNKVCCNGLCQQIMQENSHECEVNFGKGFISLPSARPCEIRCVKLNQPNELNPYYYEPVEEKSCKLPDLNKCDQNGSRCSDNHCLPKKYFDHLTFGDY